MSTRQFRLSIGAKRQLTLPAELLEQLRVPERGELLVEVIGDHAVVTPMISMPRTRLPEELRCTFESRRGADPSDTPLAQFLEEAGYEEKAQKAVAPGRPSLQERLAGLTPNERAAGKGNSLSATARAASHPADRAGGAGAGAGSQGAVSEADCAQTRSPRSYREIQSLEH